MVIIVCGVIITYGDFTTLRIPKTFWIGLALGEKEILID